MSEFNIPDFIMDNMSLPRGYSFSAFDLAPGFSSGGPYRCHLYHSEESIGGDVQVAWLHWSLPTKEDLTIGITREGFEIPKELLVGCYNSIIQIFEIIARAYDKWLEEQIEAALGGGADYE